ncbi:MAG: GNAT family N-acetyltransferase [Pseudomonadota bacterium]|nr:GNAT family N-acetyltransferase [Pseudomonadota bacterium]
MPIEVRPLTGAALRAVLPEVARLRIRVFREFPYLYVGTEAFERDYLKVYAESPGAVVVGAFDEGLLVGASTAIPMEHGDPGFAAPFVERGIDLKSVMYFGESVLDVSYRGHRIGHAFFDHREARARELGRPVTGFCSVIRPADHPSRPADYRPHDVFWSGRGYHPVPGMVARFPWLDVGESEETVKALQFWLKGD